MIQIGSTNIYLNNRDGAKLWLERTEEVEPNIFKYEMRVDYNHQYCLKYIRVIRDSNNIEAIDPSGGPFISLADEFENGKYKIIKIINPITFLISERNNDRENNTNRK